MYVRLLLFRHLKCSTLGKVKPTFKVKSFILNLRLRWNMPKIFWPIKLLMGNQFYSIFFNTDLKRGERKSLAVWTSRKELLKEYSQSFRDRQQRLQYYKDIDNSYLQKSIYRGRSTLHRGSKSTQRRYLQGNNPNNATTSSAQHQSRIAAKNTTANLRQDSAQLGLFRARVVEDDNPAPAVKLQRLLASLQGEAARRYSNLQRLQ